MLRISCRSTLGYSTMTNFDFLSDNFNTYLANKEKRKKIQQLDKLGRDCWDELQYAKAEKFYQQAAELAEQLNDLSLMISQRYGLASMQQSQGKNREALAVYTWLIEVAYNPELSRNLSEDDLWYVAQGFVSFVGVGREFPDMQVVNLEQVVERGLDWLTSIGKRHWAAGLRLEQGLLWYDQGRKEAALEELEAALALARRNPNAPGRTLSSHLIYLANLLRWLNKLDAAEVYYQEVAESHEFNAGEQRWAWWGLAWVAITRKDWAKAERCALKSLELARGIESPIELMWAYEVLGDVYWKQERVEAAVASKVKTWYYARRYGGRESNLHRIYLHFATIRLYQAKQGNPQRYIPKARRWLQWALPLAVRLDRQVGLTKRQDEIRQLQAECDAILRDSATGDN